jgi:photosystem II stability/assembly factor-like uncharacterized protein
MRHIAAIAVLSGCLFKAFAGETVASVPYHWRNVVIGGGGFVTGLITHPQGGNLFYARTDVGGAYRWDAPARRWIPVTDSFDAVDFTGIESLALDPNDTSRVYLAAGIYAGSRAAIFRSDNQGRTWQRAEVPFKMGGNETGRFNGERLVVNPKDGNILFFGSRRDGLWKSADRGATWSRVNSFPNVEEPRLAARGIRFSPRPVGIVCVLFDETTIYAAVSTTDTNLFRSTDGGSNWQPVPNQPVGLRPNHIVRASDGKLYLSYGKDPGPESMTDGAVWKFDPKNDAWTDITPVKPADAGQPFGYGAVTVDAHNPQVLLATTFCHWKPLDEIFRSTNGGASWQPLLATARFDHSFAPYTANHKPHWIGSVVINPSDSNEAWFTTGYGLWCCTNLTAADAGGETGWIFANQGLEETVPLALISPPEGAHLVSGVGDIDGFRHDDLEVSPAHGSFSGPRFGNTESLAFAAKKPSIMARTGTGRNQTHAAISKDGGKTWHLLPTEPPDAEDGAGTIALSANGKIIVWTPRRGAPSLTVDGGHHWTNCLGTSPRQRVIADPVNSSRFYAFDARSGKILASTNGASSFGETAAAFPPTAGPGDAVLSATPGLEGDLWLALCENGLYHSTDGGATFTKAGAVQNARSLGFGKAAGGSKFPTLYLAGTVGNISGLFRFVDTGATWSRINDDQHQYGAICHVTGDPRIFGRVYFATVGRGIIYGDEGKE